MKRLAFLLVILFILTSCDNTNPPFITPTIELTEQPTVVPTDLPTIDPTPTQEDSPTPTQDTSIWNLSCLTGDEGIRVSPNTCMTGRLADLQYGHTQEKPFNFNVVFLPVRNTPIVGRYIWWENDTFWIDAVFWHGKVGYEFVVDELPLACYKFIAEGESTINILSGADPNIVATNFSVDVVALVDAEEVTIGQIPIAQAWYDDFEQLHWNFAGERSLEFPFYFAEAKSDVVFRVLFTSIWDSGNHGSTFGFREIGVFRQTNFNECNGVPAL